MRSSEPTRIVSHESLMGRWEMALRAPHPLLRRHVRQYVGWIEHMTTALMRRELPTDEIPLIINFGAPVRVYEVGESSRFADLDSFATGAYDAFLRVRSQGPSGGVQVNFTIFGARLFLGRPLGELRNQSVPLEALVGRYGIELTARLRDAVSWEARFDLLDREIGARLEAAPRPSASVICTWHRLLQSGGGITIGDLVDETGWSQKHLIARFRHEIGLAPKTMARVLRFARAAARLKRAGAVPRAAASADRLADIAADCGYFDQAHFSRDFREFAGVTPTELMANMLPDGAGIQADEPSHETTKTRNHQDTKPPRHETTKTRNHQDTK
jgi:AraC-like DNA-binding protein